MGALAWLKSWLWSTGAKSDEDDGFDLTPLNVPQLKKELRLTAEGRRLGEGGVPSEDATALAGPEAEALQRVEKRRSEYVKWGARRLAILDQELQRRSVTQQVNRALQADKEFGRTASALLSKHDAVLRGLSETAAKRQAELESFKGENKLTVEAQYPRGLMPKLRIVLLLLLVLIEAIANASFFAKGLDTGLVGGAQWAALLASFNVLVAYLLGRFWVPNLNHVRAARKLFGFCGALLSVGAMVGIGLGIAHFRDALTSEAASPETVALATLTTAPAHLQDVFSWMLFGVSLMFAVIALWDGYTSDDAYPGYGKVSRLAQAAREAHDLELDGIRETLEELRDTELKQLYETAKEAQARLSLAAEHIGDKQSAKTRLDAAMLVTEADLRALLATFRDENVVAQRAKGFNPPAYFSRQPKLLEQDLPDFSIDRDIAALDEQRQLVAELLVHIEALRGGIQAAFNQQFDRVKPLGSHHKEDLAT
jgi:hypothetical protein